MDSNDNSALKSAEYSKTFELKINVNNITSSINVSSKSKLPITISEFLEQGLIVNLPPRTCSQGHQLMLDVHLSEGSKEILVFNTTAKILDIETSDEEAIRVTVKFVQYDPMIWKKFQSIYEDCQIELQHLLVRLKDSENG